MKTEEYDDIPSDINDPTWEIQKDEARRRVLDTVMDGLNDGCGEDVLVSRITQRLYTYGFKGKFDKQRGVVHMTSVLDKYDFGEMAYTPIVPCKGILIQPIKTGIFVPKHSGLFAKNLKRYCDLYRQVYNWQQLQVVGYFGAQKLKDNHVHINFTFCMPEDYIAQHNRVDKRFSLTLLHDKMLHEQLVDVDDVNKIISFPISNWMHDPSMSYSCKLTGEECFYLFHKTIKMQYDHFVDRCISYFKLKED